MSENRYIGTTVSKKTYEEILIHQTKNNTLSLAETVRDLIIRGLKQAQSPGRVL